MINIDELSAVADIDFLLACRDGDVDAFAELYARHAPTVLRFAWSRLGDRSLAEEVLQETFTTAWAKRRRASIVDLSLLPWLLAICYNHIRNQVRRRERTRTVPLDEVTVGAAPSSSDLAWIEETLGELSETDRRIVELCLIDGFSYREVADRVDSTPAAVGKRLQRARLRLRASLNAGDSE
ncbi:RNA polymerase sigma factor [Lysinimonas soli]|uniref:RNA polymerase sigma factor n=1 Tax=Lysinimonas soli TaxID=1074233 RepID=A0ABW0NR95_9MICO